MKRLFYLFTNIKLQFFKIFLLPYFNYCLSLAINLSKTALQKLCNLYYNCLYKFINLNNIEANWANDFLKCYGLFSFQHRLFYHLSMFAFKCRKLVDSLETNASKEYAYILCNINNFKLVQFDLQEGKKTFQYFFKIFK